MHLALTATHIKMAAMHSRHHLFKPLPLLGSLL
eukprot:CAMPEP_0173425514 /NCGR_PEP_ID=MMETSP1357-20121228/5216_1 /TAXON_ID=77926 /ORGANISM="Hemiselmis rufescens, Strain PCC563" /LENGTH=32 /DNA_ID= /DNA_START= /DNA_END= /DNA_ORIENTATION=